MYRVTITLEHGCKVEHVEPSFLRAAARVEEYREKMTGYEIRPLTEGGEDNSGGEVDQAGNRVAG